MTRSPSGTYWVLVVLGPCQAALAASILFAQPGAWVLTTAGYALWLGKAVRRRAATARACLALGYLLPLLCFAAAHAARALPVRPEAAETRPPTRRPPAPSPPAASDVPVPRLIPTRSSGQLLQGAWFRGRTFLYLAGCAVVGLLLHTPATVYLAAAAVAAFTVGRSEDSR